MVRLCDTDGLRAVAVVRVGRVCEGLRQNAQTCRLSCVKMSINFEKLASKGRKRMQVKYSLLGCQMLFLLPRGLLKKWYLSTLFGFNETLLTHG